MDIQGNHDADKVVALINQLCQEEHEHRIGVDGWTRDDNLKWRRKYSRGIMKTLKAIFKRIISSPEYPPKNVFNSSFFIEIGFIQFIKALFIRYI